MLYIGLTEISLILLWILHLPCNYPSEADRRLSSEYTVKGVTYFVSVQTYLLPALGSWRVIKVWDGLYGRVRWL